MTPETAFCSQQGLAKASPANLMDKVRRAYPDLQVEDAFVVPTWFPDQCSWVRDPQGSNSAVYNFPQALEMHGVLDLEALRIAMQELQARQQVLRSIFRFVGDELIQIVLPKQSVNLSLTISEAQRGPEFRRIAREEAGRPFDLTLEPAFRARLLQFSSNEHALLVTTHHLICDDWSTGILARDLFAIYQTASNSSVPPPAFQYCDFIRWQERQLQGAGLESRLSFWQRQLAGGSSFHHLETDHPRTARRSFRGVIQREVLPEGLTNSLRTFSQNEKVSLFMTMLAGFQCVLHRFSNDDDVALGSCAANRPLTELEGLIGRFANDLVIRTDLSENPTFRDLLSRVRKSALTAYSYQDLPFARLIQEGTPQRESNRNALFQVMFILQDAPKGTVQSPGLTIDRVPLDVGTAKYDLALFLNLHRELEIAFEYNCDLFEPATIRLIWDHYKKTLEEMVNDPQARINDSDVPKRPPTPQLSSPQQERVSMQETAMESKLVEIWEANFGIRPINAEDDFFQLGGDSLLASRLFVRIEEVFNVKIPLVTLIQAPTIKQLARVIRESRVRGTLRSLVLIQAGNARPPLFCVHGQSGNLLIYRSLARHMGPKRPVYGLQPQGMDGKIPPLDRIEEMASNYVDEIRDVQPNGPYFLAGYCMGGLIALEMAQQLSASGEEVALVGLLDTYNVHKMKPSLLSNLRFNLQRGWFGLCHFLLTTPEYKLTFVRRRLSELNNNDSAVSESNKRAAFAYRPHTYAGRILHVSPLRQYAIYTLPELAWDDLAAGGVESLTLPIYPGQMFEEPFVEELAAKMTACMDGFVQKKIA